MGAEIPLAIGSTGTFNLEAAGNGGFLFRLTPDATPEPEPEPVLVGDIDIIHTYTDAGFMTAPPNAPYGKLTQFGTDWYVLRSKEFMSGAEATASFKFAIPVPVGKTAGDVGTFRVCVRHMWRGNYTVSKQAKYQLRKEGVVPFAETTFDQQTEDDDWHDLFGSVSLAYGTTYCLDMPNDSPGYVSGYREANIGIKDARIYEEG